MGLLAVAAGTRRVIAGVATGSRGSRRRGRRGRTDAAVAVVVESPVLLLLLGDERVIGREDDVALRAMDHVHVVAGLEVGQRGLLAVAHDLGIAADIDDDTVL